MRLGLFGEFIGCDVRYITFAADRRSGGVGGGRFLFLPPISAFEVVLYTRNLYLHRLRTPASKLELGVAIRSSENRPNRN